MSARHCAPVILRLCPSSIPFLSEIKTDRTSFGQSASLRAKRSNPDCRLEAGLLRRFAPRNDGIVLILEHCDGADRRAGALAPFQRQPDELKLALPQQRLEIAQAFHMRDVEF